jgi:hypothetical protein
MVVRFGVSPCGGDVDLGCLEACCRGEYFDLRQRKLQEDKRKLHSEKLRRDLWGSGGKPPRILSLDTRWRWVVNMTSRPFYSRRKNCRWAVKRKLGARVSLDAWKERKYFALRESNPDSSVVRILWFTLLTVFIKIIESRRISWAIRTTLTSEMRDEKTVLVNLKEKENFVHLRIGGETKLKSISKHKMVKFPAGLNRLLQHVMTSCCN